MNNSDKTQIRDEYFHNTMIPALDSSVRQAVVNCWMLLPLDRKSMDEVAKEMRRLVDRAIRDLGDDLNRFPMPNS